MTNNADQRTIIVDNCNLVQVVSKHKSARFEQRRGLTDGLRCAEPAPAPAFADADAATDELVFVTGTPSARIAATGVVVAERGNTYKH